MAAATLNLNEGITVAEAGSGTIDNTLLHADDPDSPGAVMTYTLVTTPANGDLTLSSAPLAPNDQFTQTDIDNNLLAYTHDDSETLADSFDFTVATSATNVPQTTFVITITPVFDQTPVVLDQEFDVAENSSAGTVIDTVEASDSDAGDSLNYSIVGGNFGTPFAITNTTGVVSVNSEAPLDFETNQTLTFTVQVEDSGASTDTAEITINILDQNEAPTLSGGPFSVEENASNNTLVGTVTTDDEDAGETFTYEITGSDPAAAFAIDNNGDITVSDNSQLDFETNPTFTITVKVEDSGLLSDTADFIINLTDANDPPEISSAGPFSIPENSADSTPVGTPIPATDQDLGAGDSLLFSIEGGNTGGAFGINSTSGQLFVANGSVLDFDTPPTSYNLTIQVEDEAGETDSEIVQVNLTDVNEPPTAPTATFTPNENLGDGNLIGHVPATDPEDDDLNFAFVSGNTNSAFSLDEFTGAITVNDETQLDFETTPSFALTIAVDDGVNPSVNATVNINLVDLNENPQIDDDTFDVDENSSNGSLVGTVNADDPDAADEGELTFTILSGDDGGAFAIANDGSNNGRITVADSSQLDYETTETFSLSIRVEDLGSLDNTATVTITINNLFDEPPVVSNSTFFVQQGADNGVLVGTVSATDPELASGDALTYSIIGGNTGTVFAINSSNGQITVPDTSKLDANAMPTFNLTVRAIDNGGQMDTGTITINVTPLPITYVYLPFLLNNYPPIEPNNNCSQAAAVSNNIDYQFTSDDVEDWYSLTLVRQQNVTIILSSFEPAQGQLIVYGGTCGGTLPVLQSDGSSSTTKSVTLNNLAAGTYYIRVYSAPVTNTTYTLRVNLN